MKNDKTYKKLEENWKKLKEGIMPPMLAFNTGAQLATANAGRQIANNASEPTTRQEAAAEVARLRKIIANEVEYNYGRMTDEAQTHLERVWELEERFKLPSSTPQEKV
jgi:hypothetical protein